MTADKVSELVTVATVFGTGARALLVLTMPFVLAVTVDTVRMLCTINSNKIQPASSCDIPESTLVKSVSLQPTYASLDALYPCMIELFLAVVSTILEPSTPASTTATLARFLHIPAFETRDVS